MSLGREDGWWWRAVASTLRSDPLARATLALFVAALVLYLLPILNAAQKASLSWAYMPLPFLVLVVGALLKDLPRIHHPRERWFWRDLAAAFGCWLAVAVLRLFQPRPELSLAQSLVEDLLWVGYYLALVHAVERRAHRRGDRRPEGFERALSWPGTTVFVFGLLVYFVLIPALTGHRLYDSDLPSIYLYLCLDIYLTVHLVYLSRIARVERWRAIYSLLALTTGSILVADILEALRKTVFVWEWGTVWDPWWNLPYLWVVLAARVRHYPFSERRLSGSRLRPWAEDFSGPHLYTMAAALSFPLFHLLFHRLGLLDEEGRPARDLLVLVWMVLLGSIALVQQRSLDRRMRRLWRQRAEFADSLHEREEDLRLMIERRHGAARLRLKEEQLTLAVRASPDPMAVNSFAEGRFLEVNESFEEMFALRRAELVGRTAEELGLWARRAEGERARRMLRRDGAVRDLEVAWKRPGGEEGTALLSTELSSLGGELCLVSSLRDLREDQKAWEEARRQAALVEEAADAISLVDAEGRVGWWNRSAEELYGWSAEEVRGRSVDRLAPADKRQAVREARRRTAAEGSWIGELPQVGRDGRRLRVASWWTAVRGDEGTAILIASWEVPRRDPP